LAILALCVCAAHAAGYSRADTTRWRSEALSVRIVRDPWGIAHVYGRSDADAVFGAVYAQAEDDFPRIERNYLAALGWLARAEGEAAIYADLRQRLFVQPSHLRQLYRTAPVWLRKLALAWADALNFYLSTHPDAGLAVMHRFEPWMALSFTEGSIGGDIESVDLDKLRQFYGAAQGSATATWWPPSAPDMAAGGSNGFAIAPRLSATGHALLWINPHTSFYFRSELQMTSANGLNAYGAATWGQFFIYQGFNSHNGWMHTSYGGDAIDEYAETVVRNGPVPRYAYAGGQRPMHASPVRIGFKQGPGQAYRDFTVYRSHHGPIVRAEGGKWIAVRLLEDPVRALEQSFLRTKTTDYRSFRKIQDMRTDTSNTTIYADTDGTIAYFHGNFIPRRDPRFDYTRPVDGSDPATEWHGPHAIEETITLLNPRSGWIQNTNNWPFSAAGADSPRRENYPAYMWVRGENPRGLHAVEVLKDLHDATLDGLIAAAYDSHLTAFDVLLPQLFQAFEALDAGDPRRSELREPVEVLRAWDHRTEAHSVATAVAIFWGNAMLELQEAAAPGVKEPVFEYLASEMTDGARLHALELAIAALERDFGSWRTAWGEINRYQRLTGDILQRFDDDQPSIAIGFAPARWGALASFDSARPRSTRRIYGSMGNSFVAAVEFANPVRAKAIMIGGASGDPSSPHFGDQAAMYARGEFRDVLFTPEDVAAHAERSYHPGDR
jgi:acyl-homoserine-lactone acylase